MKKYRRYEVLLPLRFNDGSPVPDGLVADALVELRHKFGAVSSETQRIEGQWQHAGQVYRDELMRVFVDVADTQHAVGLFVQDTLEIAKGILLRGDSFAMTAAAGATAGGLFSGDGASRWVAAPLGTASCVCT